MGTCETLQSTTNALTASPMQVQLEERGVFVCVAMTAKYWLE